MRRFYIFWLFLRLSWLWQSNLEILFASSSPFSICGKSNFFVTVTVFLLLMPGRVLQNIDTFFHMTCQKKSNDTWILSVDYRGLILVFSETPKSGETVQWPSIPIWGRKMDVVQNHLFFSGWTQKNHQTYITKNLYPEFIFILFSNWEVAKLKIKMIANGPSVTQDFHHSVFSILPAWDDANSHWLHLFGFSP